MNLVDETDMQEVIECEWSVCNAPGPHLNLSTAGRLTDLPHYHQALQLVQELCRDLYSLIKLSA